MENYLRENFDRFNQCLDNKDYEFLLKCCSEVAEAMMFLVSKGIIHADLAARNVLLTSDLTVKLADFGLSQRLYIKQGGRTCQSAIDRHVTHVQLA